MIWRLFHREAVNKVAEPLLLLQISTLLHLHLVKCSLREENQLGIDAYNIMLSNKVQIQKYIIVFIVKYVYVIVIHWEPRNYGSKQTNPEGAARG